MSRYVYDAMSGAVQELPDNPVEQMQQPTPAELQARYTALLDAHIDAKARERGYDSRVTCALRAGYPGPFQTEGQAFAPWMDDCYEKGQQVLADVTAGTRQMPTPEAFIAELPPMVWPEAAQ